MHWWTSIQAPLEFVPLEFVPLEFVPLEFEPLEFVPLEFVPLEFVRDGRPSRGALHNGIVTDDEVSIRRTADTVLGDIVRN